MEPLPETRQALAEIVSLEDPDPEELLNALGAAARRVVPQLIGLSVGLGDSQLTFTLVASDDEIAALDATQYLEGGPCVEVAEGRAELAEFVVEDPLDEAIRP